MNTKPKTDRFQTPKRVLFYDRFMNYSIKIGGVSIIVAVLGIFVFILSQVIPLFLNATVERQNTVQLQNQNYQILGMDEWGELPFLATADGKIIFLDLKSPQAKPKTATPFATRQDLTVYQYQVEDQTLLYANPAGEFAWAKIHYQPEFDNGNRTIQWELSTTPFFSLLPPEEETETKLLDLKAGEEEDFELVVGIVETPTGKRQVRSALLRKEEDLLGKSTLNVEKYFDLTDSLPGIPQKIRVNESGDVVLISTDQGDVAYFHRQGEELALKQTFKPFEKTPIASMNFLLGGVSAYFTNAQGDNVLYSLLIPKGQDTRLFAKTKTFDKLPQAAQSFSKSLRNKAFLIGSGPLASLRYGTTESIRWEETFPHNITQTALSKKYHRLALLDETNQLHLYELNDPHPEGGWKAFFGKIWYEGAPEPQYTWQSTGGSDAFESKLSLMPLIIGTLKGTFYALLFAVPIALLAAVYTSQFLDPNLKKIIKPVMEIMASLPSVILGFLAALWLAPRIEDKVPSLILTILLIPLAAFAFGLLWAKLPKRWRAKIPEGREWIALIPFVLVSAWIAWELGPLLEKVAFVATDPSTGERIADFRLWWPQITETSFEQRNSLVVGFIMGFAVIPIIFTISEDSLSAVPTSLRSASLALGASRWQTAYRVVLPAATAGIFSAIMIGFGRAVGETMIVLMATGNTPLTDFNLFSGMRTLSANLAVELPEAPFQSTLYRTLFLGALVLFLMTFSVNSLAETMRQRIRKKLKAL